MHFSSAARGRPIIVEWERDARHSAGLSLVRRFVLTIVPVWGVVVNETHARCSRAAIYIKSDLTDKTNFPSDESADESGDLKQKHGRAASGGARDPVPRHRVIRADTRAAHDT
ncbi:hypothetical protein EVAR_87920_1 [Eumeta japonica]|uniref:Uncharacterized protein n=1 Tax=Eumeta variegata TaxID=151549 RepID=A0A4C1WTL6_EUMVA|nr:hypothetical protein EVAR_87920_1 [Eumeta japonica]